MKWVKTANGEGMNIGSNVTLDQDKNVYIQGIFTRQLTFQADNDVIIENNSGNFDICIAKYDNLGNFLWAYSMGGSDDDFANCIKTDSDNACLVAGVFNESATFNGASGESSLTGYGNKDFFLIKYEDNGSSDIDDKTMTKSYNLLQNYPNPFNPVTKISYNLEGIDFQTALITVYNNKGEKVWQYPLLKSNALKGSLQFKGSKLNSGVYYYSLTVDGQKLSMKKMILIK